MVKFKPLGLLLECWKGGTLEGEGWSGWRGEGAGPATEESSW